MKNYICIDGKKTEISQETAANLKKQFGVTEPEHGDYRVTEDGSIQFFVRDGYRGIIRLCQHDYMFDGPIKDWSIIENPVRSGNIFDLIKAKDC